MSTLLRDGTSIDDPRLDRIEEFDDRSRDYDIDDVVSGRTLRSYTWRCNKWLNQGRYGACVGFSFAHDICARPKEVHHEITNQYARERIYFEAQKIDRFEGGEFPGANPRSGGTSILAGAKIAKRLGWFDEFRWAFNTTDVLLTLGYVGPVIVGVRWYSGMSNPTNGYATPEGRYIGKHAVLLNAVSIKRQDVTLHNSWGDRWGAMGTARIRWEHLDELLRDRGDACIPMMRRSNGHPTIRIKRKKKG